MSTTLRNRVTGERITTSYSMIDAYYPWEIISDSAAEVAVKRVLKAVEKEIKEGEQHVLPT